MKQLSPRPVRRVPVATRGLYSTVQPGGEAVHLLVLRSGMDPATLSSAAVLAATGEGARACSPHEALALLQQPGYATVIADARAVESCPEGRALERLLEARVRSGTAELTWLVVDVCTSQAPAVEPRGC